MAPARIYNLGSSAARELRFGHEERLWRQMGDRMRQTALQIPVFLVNPAQMDVLYPPRRKKCLDTDRAKNILREYDREDDNLSISRLEKDAEGDWQTYEVFVAVGLYVPCHSENWPDTAEEVLERAESDSMDPQVNYAGMPFPHIYLCPERILEGAESLGIEPQLYLEAVYYHELAHALMDSNPKLNCHSEDPYLTLWGRTIEESSANWITCTRFQEPDVYLVQKIIASQPLEYQGYLALGKPPLYSLPAKVDSSPAEFRREMRREFRRVLQAESARAMLISKGPSIEGPPDYASWEAVQKIIYTLLNPLLLSRYFGTVLNPRYSEIILTSLMIPYVQGMQLERGLGSPVPGRTAWGRIFQWIEYKKKGAPRDPGYVIYWEELALFVLAASVKTSL